MGYFKWADRQLQDLIAQNPTYTRSQFPGKRLGIAQSILNSRMPGAGQYQNNVFTNQASTMNNVGKFATDASQALAFNAAAQAGTDKSLADLQLQEADWTKFGLGNLNDAYAAMADEDRMVEEQKQLNFQNQVSLKGAQAANKFAKRQALWNTVGSIANLGVGAATGGLFKGLFKGGGNKGMSGGGGMASAGNPWFRNNQKVTKPLWQM